MKKAVLLIIVFLLTSCGAARYIKNPIVQKDTVYVSTHDVEVQKDSVYVYKDKIIKEKGDTIYIKETLYEYKDRWRDKEVHDTLYVDKIQTITETVEKKLTGLQKFFLTVGKILTLLLLAFIGYKIYSLIKKFRVL